MKTLDILSFCTKSRDWSCPRWCNFITLNTAGASQRSAFSKQIQIASETSFIEAFNSPRRKKIKLLLKLSLEKRKYKPEGLPGWRKTYPDLKAKERELPCEEWHLVWSSQVRSSLVKSGLIWFSLVWFGLVGLTHSPCWSVGMVARLDEWKGTA